MMLNHARVLDPRLPGRVERIKPLDMNERIALRAAVKQLGSKPFDGILKRLMTAAFTTASSSASSSGSSFSAPSSSLTQTVALDMLSLLLGGDQFDVQTRAMSLHSQFAAHLVNLLDSKPSKESSSDATAATPSNTDVLLLHALYLLCELGHERMSKVLMEANVMDAVKRLLERLVRQRTFSVQTQQLLILSFMYLNMLCVYPAFVLRMAAARMHKCVIPVIMNLEYDQMALVYQSVSFLGHLCEHPRFIARNDLSDSQAEQLYLKVSACVRAGFVMGDAKEKRWAGDEMKMARQDAGSY